MIKVNVICGGDSAEREVSLRSGEAVNQALQKAGYSSRILDATKATIDEIATCDVVFPVLHGAGGEDGTIQLELEKRNIKFVGTGSKASALCFDKWEYRKVITNNNLQMAKGELVTAANFSNNKLIQSPFVLKPFNGGSSVDTLIARESNEANLLKAKDLLNKYPKMLLEELIFGTELTVGILGDEALPIIKIVPPIDGEFDYENKYNGKSQEVVAPKDVPSKIQKMAQELALKAHNLTGCRDFSRTDMICDKSGKLFLLETNTIPGMTDQSLFPKMAAAGLSMPRLCDQLVQLALSR